MFSFSSILINGVSTCMYNCNGVEGLCQVASSSTLSPSPCSEGTCHIVEDSTDCVASQLMVAICNGGPDNRDKPVEGVAVKKYIRLMSVPKKALVESFM